MKKIIIMYISILLLHNQITAQQLPDSAIKRNIVSVNHSLEKLIQLEPVRFEFDTKKHMHLKLKSGLQYGFLADNMENIFPELVSTRKVSYMFGKNVYRDVKIKTIDEISLIPLLVASVKEQQAEIEKLKKVIAELKTDKSAAVNQGK